jgi:hypothetical protein
MYSSLGIGEAMPASKPRYSLLRNQSASYNVAKVQALEQKSTIQNKKHTKIYRVQPQRTQDTVHNTNRVHLQHSQDTVYNTLSNQDSTQCAHTTHQVQPTRHPGYNIQHTQGTTHNTTSIQYSTHPGYSPHHG